jgi:hypothetical protein
MNQWQPQHDQKQTKQQPGAVPPQFQNSAPSRPDGTRGYAQQPQYPQHQAPQPVFQQGYNGQPNTQGYYPPPQQPYAPRPPQRPRGKSRAPLFAGLGCGGLAALVILIAVVAGSNSSSSAPPAGTQQTQAAAPASSAAAAQTVTYVVSGSHADVTYGPAGSDSSGTVPMNVTKPIAAPAYYAISAQLQGDGTVSCKILVDGKVVSQGTANGGYNIAQCEIVKDPISGQWQDTNG